MLREKCRVCHHRQTSWRSVVKLRVAAVGTAALDRAALGYLAALLSR